jgi:hypothetical protein
MFIEMNPEPEHMGGRSFQLQAHYRKFPLFVQMGICSDRQKAGRGSPEPATIQSCSAAVLKQVVSAMYIMIRCGTK